MKPLWDYERNQTLISTYRNSQIWAKRLCQVRGGTGFHAPEVELYRALGKRLAGVLAGTARRMVRGPRHTMSTEEFAKAIVPRRWFRSSLAEKAIRELSDASRGYEQDLSLPLVNPYSDHTRYQIELRAGAECRDALGVFRIRAHYFRINGVQLSQHPTHMIGQIVREYSRDQATNTVEWDTIRENNLDYPFWPRANNTKAGGFLHRCSLHSVGDALEWSDWPQIGVKASPTTAIQWRFTTGLFERIPLGHGFQFDLVSRHDWAVDWSVPSR